MVKNRILVLDDEKVIQQLLVRTFGEDRYHVETAEDSGTALKRMKEEPFDLLITDLKMPRVSGMDVLKEVKSVNPHTEVIIITGYPTIELAVEAVKMGAFDFICKPFDLAEMKTTVGRCLEKQRSGPKIEASIEYANSIIGTLREPFLVLDKRLRVISANHAFYATFEVAEKETIGRPLPDLGDRQWNIPKLLQLLREIIPERKIVKDYDVEHKFEKIGERTMILNACQLHISHKIAAMITKRAVAEEEDLILLAIEDITGRKLLENDINELILTVSKEMGFKAGNKVLGLTVNLSEKTPKIKFDHDKIVQVVTNLLSNAIKFTEKGSISITAKSEDNVVHVMVEDTGLGIPAEDMSRLFQTFEQLGGGVGKRIGGTGLGLAISKEIILAHNGKMWAESQFGKGSTFHFTLPIKERRG